MSKTLDEAIETALQAIERDKQVVAPEYRCGYIITEQDSRYNDGSGAFRVYRGDDWARPTESLLPWAPPSGEPIRRVSKDGRVSQYKHI